MSPSLPLHPWMPEPLALCYEGLPSPQLTVVQPEQMPSPYRQLLVHERTMTHVLEGFLGQPLRLRVLSCKRIEHSLWRQVVLVQSEGERPVEFGAIRIDLSCFDARTREQLLEGRVPLGRLVEDSRRPYTSQPERYFHTEADALLRESLSLDGARRLFGRWNRLRNAEGRVMAEVVELLPPLEASHVRDGKWSSP